MRKRVTLIAIMLCFILIPTIYLTIIYHQAMFNPISIAPSESVDELVQQLTDKSDDLLNTYGVPGLAIAFISNNNTDMIVRGRADYWKNLPLTENHYFQLASVSKTQCAFAIMKLVEEGLVDLDFPVETYLTSWSLPENGFDNNGVTIRRILCHVAGLSVSGVPGVLKQANLPSIQEALTEADVKVIAEPGSVYMYSGGGYGILQLVIEEVTGLTYDEYLYSEILHPLGLNNTHTQWVDFFSDQIAKGYGNFYLPSILSFTPFQAAASHYSTILDFTKWCEMFIYGQSVLNSSLVDLMLTPQYGENWGYSLGFEWKKLANGLSTLGHNGDNWGYHSSFRFSRTTGDGLVIMTNGDRGALLRDHLVAVWENIIGENSDSGINFGNQKRSTTITAITMSFTAILTIAVVLGFKYRFLSLDSPTYNFRDSSRKRKLLLILRISISSLLTIGFIFFVLLFGWTYGGFSYAPFYFIWTDIIMLMVTAWTIPASQIIQFDTKFIKRKLRK